MGILRRLKALIPESEAKQVRELEAAAPDVVALLAAQDDAERLRRDGHPGTATITRVSGTGIFMGETEDNEAVEFALDVIVNGGAPYSAVHRQVVTREERSRYQPGASVHVRVDTRDPQRLTIVG